MFLFWDLFLSSPHGFLYTSVHDTVQLSLWCHVFYDTAGKTFVFETRGHLDPGRVFPQSDIISPPPWSCPLLGSGSLLRHRIRYSTLILVIAHPLPRDILGPDRTEASLFARQLNCYLWKRDRPSTGELTSSRTCPPNHNAGRPRL